MRKSTCGTCPYRRSAILWPVYDARPLAGERYHLLGIAGRGMAPLALAAQHLGAEVSGCDRRGSAQYVDLLNASGLSVATAHAADHVRDGTTVVATSLADPDEPEIRIALAAGRLWHRTDLLATLLRLRRSAGVSGSHGKGTVTALTAAALAEAGLDPLAIIGAVVPSFGGPTLLGQGPIVAGVDDSDLTLARVDTDVAAVTNLDHDHPYLGHTLAQSVAAVGEFVGRARELVLLGPSPRAEQLAAYARVEVWRVGRELSARTLGVERGETRLELRAPGGIRERATVRLIGPRTGHNAALAFGTALALGADPEPAAAGLGSVTSVAHRLEPVGARDGIRVFADYGYKHPVNMRTGLAALRRHFPEARITAVFEPFVGYLAPWGHRYARALGGADHVVLAPPARASDFPDGRAFDSRWADACPVRPVQASGRQEAVEAGLGLCGPGDVLVLFGMSSALFVMTEHALGQAS